MSIRNTKKKARNNMFNSKKRRIRNLEVLFEEAYKVIMELGEDVKELENSVDFWKFISEQRKGFNVMYQKRVESLSSINATYKKEISDLCERLKEKDNTIKLLQKPMCTSTHRCVAVFPSQVKDAEELFNKESRTVIYNCKENDNRIKLIEEDGVLEEIWIGCKYNPEDGESVIGINDLNEALKSIGYFVGKTLGIVKEIEEMKNKKIMTKKGGKKPC